MSNFMIAGFTDFLLSKMVALFSKNLMITVAVGSSFLKATDEKQFEKKAPNYHQQRLSIFGC